MAERYADLSGDYTTDMTSLKEALNSLLEDMNPRVNFGGTVASVSIASGPDTQVITHNLNREPRGILPLTPTTAAVLYIDAKNTTTITVKIDSGSYSGDVLVY
jgi:hypothetical protein